MVNERKYKLLNINNPYSQATHGHNIIPTFKINKLRYNIYQTTGEL